MGSCRPARAFRNHKVFRGDFDSDSELDTAIKVCAIILQYRQWLKCKCCYAYVLAREGVPFVFCCVLHRAVLTESANARNEEQ